MQKYYFSKVIGTGSSRDPYRVKAADTVGAASVLAFIPVDPVTGVPTRTTVLCIVEAPGLTHAALVADADHLQLPDPALLKIKYASLAQGIRTAMENAATAAGFDLSFVPDSFKEWVNKIGKQCDPAFDVNTFTIA